MENHGGVSGSARIIFSDMRQLRIDFKLPDEINETNTVARKKEIKNDEINAYYEKQFSKIEKLRQNNEFREYFDIECEFENDKFTGNVIIILKKDLRAKEVRENQIFEKVQ